MKLTINTDVLKKYNLTLRQFLVLLPSYYNLDYQEIQDELVEAGLAERNLFKEFPPVISDNTKNLVAKILVESNDSVFSSGIDFEKLAKTLQEHYPDGVKAGKTYLWRGTIREIAQKLRVLIAHGFSFTEQEAIQAVEEYVASFKPPYTYMHTLRNFLAYTRKNPNGVYETESIFMTIIENNREKEEYTGGEIGDLDDAMG